MLPNHIYVSQFEATIPELKEALAVLQGVGLHVVLIEDSATRPKDAHAVLSSDLMSDSRVCGAALLVEQRLRIPIRHDREKPVGTIEAARARGFSDEEIAAELRPWRAAAVAGSEEAERAAEATAKAARAATAAARKAADAPLVDGTG